MDPLKSSRAIPLYCLMAIENHNDQEAVEILTCHFNRNAKEMMRLINLNNIFKYERKKYHCLVVKYISSATTDFRFRPGSILSKILAYHFQLVNNSSEEYIYQQIKNKDHLILNYLSIHHEKELKDKILQVINTYCIE